MREDECSEQDKDDMPLDQDARPIVVGEAFRRIAGKLALLGDKEQLSGWLRPTQVAVGVKAGAEVIVHSLRQWWERNQDNANYVLLKMDYANAFNEAEPEAFLGTARRRLPGAAKMAYWCYGRESALIYNGRVLKTGGADYPWTASRGQQGCPLMMPMFCAMKKEMRDRVDGVRDVDFMADFADDGVLGGDWDKVLKVLRGEIAIGGEYGVRNNFSKMLLYPLAGHRFNETQER